MKKWLKSLTKSRYSYEPLIRVKISRKKLINNIKEFIKIAPNGQIAPVLKSNAYGHGLLEIARILTDSGCNIPFFVVDSYFEAVALRNNGMKAPLLIIGYTRPEVIAQSKLKRTSFTVSGVDTLLTLADYPEIGSPIHLKIDTGMRRQGILPREIDRAIKVIRDNGKIILEGVASHLSDADNPDPTFTKTQIDLWNNLVEKFKNDFPAIKYFHLSNTDGHKFSGKINASLSRLGIGMYGLINIPNLDLSPTLSMKTIITGLKTIEAGDTIGYSRTFKAKNDMRIANIPVGYFEGLDRRLSNNGCVLVGEKRVPCPIVGRVGMNITTIDVTNAGDVEIGTPVVVISDNTSDPNSIVSIARKCNTIPYEIVVKIPAHLKRVVGD